MLDIKQLVLKYGMNIILKSLIDYLGSADLLKNKQFQTLRKDLWTALEKYDPRYKNGAI